MMDRLYCATTHGIVVLDRDGQEWSEIDTTLRDRQITAVAAGGETLLAGTREGLFRSPNLGRTWHEIREGLTERYVRWLAFHPHNSSLVFSGTEPAALFVSGDAGATWRACPEVSTLRDEHRWRLPYSPAAGCVRGFAFHEDRAYAAVEVGGLLRSDDRGRSWRLATGSSGEPSFGEVSAGQLHPDVHSVTGHTTSPDLLFAATGGGLYRSADGGASWELLYRCYCRAVWVDPGDPDRIILGPATGVARDGRIEGSRDGGKHWERLMGGLAERWPSHMVERFLQAGDDLLAVLSDGSLICATVPDRAGSEDPAWHLLLPSQAGVAAAAYEPG